MMGWLFGSSSESGNVRTVQKGFFESEESFARRVQAAGDYAPPEQHRQARATLEKLEKQKKAEADKRRRDDERKKRAAAAAKKAKEAAQKAADAARKAKEADERKRKTKPNNNPSSWW